MRLIIITQKVDRKDPVLGFFHRWIEEFSRACDSVIVIAQCAGAHKFPANVRVLSLGKEDGVRPFAQVRRAWKILWDFRRDYDAVLVHMTPVWVLLAFPLLLLLRKRRYLWYEVRRGGWKLRGAVLLCRKVFCATVAGLPFRSRKAVIVGHGIDVEEFSPGESPRDPTLIVAAGRVTPVKNYGSILRAFAQLPNETHLVIAGGTVTPSDAEELARLHDLEKRLGLGDGVEIRARTHDEVRDLFRSATLSLHACDGGLDKVVLEAMACGCPVVSSSSAAALVLPSECRATKETLADAANAILALPAEARSVLGQRLRTIVVDGHSLVRLVTRLVEEMA